MSEKYIIALDQGTSGCRAFAVDMQGRVYAQQSRVFSPRRSGTGISEYNAEELLHAQQEVLQALLDQIDPRRVLALAVCSQRSTIVLWDKSTGQSVAPVLTWEDGRALQESVQAPLSQEEVHAQTGLFKTPFFSAPKIAWCLKHIPAARQAAQAGTLLAAPVASYLIWKLTCAQVFATDPTLAQRTLLWDIRTGQWSKTLTQAFGVPLACLPTVKPTMADYGHYEYRGVSIPIVVCTADQQAAATYNGLVAGKTSINYGTGAFVLHHTGTKLVILPGMLSSVDVSDTSESTRFLLEGPVFSAGSVLQWLKTKGLLSDFVQIDALCATAQAPVQFLPALGGLGAPYWDYTASVHTGGVYEKTRPADWVAGALQGVALRVADIFGYLSAHGQQTVDPVCVSGGLCQSHYLLSFEADVLQHTLQVQNDTESTVLGTALLAMRYLYGTEQAWKTSAGHIFSPRMTQQQSQTVYQDWQQFVQIARSHG